MLTSVTIKGFKCLRDVTVDLEPFTVLIGPNDSGKSSFLQAIDAAGINERVGRASRVGVLDIALVGADGAAHRVTTARGEPGVLRGGNVGGSMLWMSQHQGPKVGPIVSFDAVRIAAPAEIATGSLQKLIETRGQGAAAYLAQVALGDRDRFNGIQGDLRDVSQGRIVEARVSEPNPNYQLSFKLRDGTVVPASEMSQGVLLYLAFLCLVHRQDRPDVLLIEEPESGLHPLRLHELVTLLRTLNAVGVQVILTTHSPDLLSACQSKEVRVFLRPEPGSPTEVHRLPAHFDAIAMRQSIGQIWASRGEAGLLDMLPKAQPFAHAEPEPA